LVNFRLAQQLNDDKSSTLLKIRHSSDSSTIKHKHVLAAVNGFVQAICLGSKRWSASVQQDLLNLLACLFWYGENPDICSVIKAKVASIAPEAWLGVLPQLLARIHMRSSPIQTVIYPILERLGEKHPQALMYPLSVLLKSPVKERKEAAESLMISLKQHSHSLVEEALMVSSELIRVAILWLELWHEGLEDASRLYFGEGNVAGMLEVLIPLHEQLERGPTTIREQDFHKSFGRDLAEAYSFLKEYIRLKSQNTPTVSNDKRLLKGLTVSNENPQFPTGNQENAEAEAALNQAWDLYYTVFRRINKQLPGLTSLELSQSSPALLQAHSLELGVPGSYRVNGTYVKIEKFIPSVQVIASKQRPRKLTIRGGDGKDYVFLLKGHEDLRQDERVMQLFGLVNALFTRDRRTNFHDLSIQRYAIAPLSHNVGLVGWVPHCDTFHSLIRDYRDMKRVPLNMENREMLKLAPDYDVLTVMQKVEVFSEALDRTTGKGNDLYEILWIKSTNSEEWLERRTKFTRSLGVMSMVGYILGLGENTNANFRIVSFFR
jgi:FKBP12-rapamycin complex-associated protein